MSGPQRNPDRINTIGIVVVGICGAVLVYVSIAALQAFYMNDSSEIQTMADYGGNDTTAKSIRTAQIHNITDVGSNPADPKRGASYHINIDDAMKLVVQAAKADPAATVPAVGRSDKPTVEPIYGRPKPIAGATPPAGADGAGSAAGAGAGSADQGAGAGSADQGAGAGSGAAATPGAEAAPMVPTGAGGGPARVGGTGAAPPPTSTGGDLAKPAPAGARPPTPTAPDNRAPHDKAAGSGAGSAAKGNGK